MEFRPTPDVDPVELSFDEFAVLVRTGTVRPKAQYRSKWTNYEWRSVDRIPKFLELIPPNYEYEEELKERRAEIAWDLRDAERSAQFQASYASGALIERCYSLKPLEQIAPHSGVVGVARFFILPSFETERVVTFRFGAESIFLEGVYGEKSVYHECANQGPPQHPYVWRVIKTQGELKYSEVPMPLKTWKTYLRYAADLPSCWSFVLDGVGYLQKILVKGEVVIADWSNPGADFPKQINMVHAYFECLRKAGMGDLRYW